MKVFLANIPLWMFPEWDADWAALKDMPLFALADGFTNNCIKSRWYYDRERAVYTCRKLAELGKVYLLTAVDRNINLAPTLGLPETASDNDIRMRLLTGIKGLQERVFETALTEAADVAAIAGSQPLMPGNGAESDDTVEVGGPRFPWDTLGRNEGWAIFENVLWHRYPGRVWLGEYRHRYWHKAGEGDGPYLKHYHTTRSKVYDGGVYYSEVGVHDTLGDDEKYLTWQWRTFTRWRPRMFAIHGLGRKVQSTSDITASWQPNDELPRKRYDGLLASKTGGYETLVLLMKEAREAATRL